VINCLWMLGNLTSSFLGLGEEVGASNEEDGLGCLRGLLKKYLSRLYVLMGLLEFIACWFWLEVFIVY